VVIEIPELALVVLVGPAGAGKSTFARARFRPTEVVSSDACRALVADDERTLSATPDAFQVLHLVAALRLRRGRLTVVDAVSARPADRRPLLELAAAHDCAAVAIVFDLPAELCVERDRARGRTVGERVVRAQRDAVARSLPGLREEGFEAVHVLPAAPPGDAATVRRVPLPVNRRRERGPFDVVGDVHGCLAPLLALLQRLGYTVGAGPGGEPANAVHPDGRRLVFVGDLAGPGPDGDRVERLVSGMAATGSALRVRGDHDGEGLPSHLVLAGGSLVVTHAGIRREMVGRDSARVRWFCLAPEAGWADDYTGRALVVHGHDPVPCPRWRGRTLNVDTGCVGGGLLTSLRHPELELVSVPGQPAG